MQFFNTDDLKDNEMQLVLLATLEKNKEGKR